MSTASWLRRWLFACLAVVLAHACSASGQSPPIAFRLSPTDLNRFILPPLSPDADERALTRQHHETWLTEFEALQRTNKSIILWRLSHTLGTLSAVETDEVHVRRSMQYQWLHIREAAFLARDLESQFFDDLALLLPNKAEQIESLFHQHSWRRAARSSLLHADVAAVELDIRMMLDEGAPDWTARPDIASLVRLHETKQHGLIREFEDISWHARIVSERLHQEFVEANRNQTPGLPARIRANVDQSLQSHRALMRLRMHNLQTLNALLPLLSGEERAAVESLADPVIDRPFFIASEGTERLLAQIRMRTNLTETDRAALEALVARINADRRKAASVMRPLYENILAEETQRAIMVGHHERPADVPELDWAWPEVVLRFEAQREAWNEIEAAHAEALKTLIAERPAIGERPVPADLESMVARQWNIEELTEPCISKASIDAFVRLTFPENSAMQMVVDSAWSEFRAGLAENAAAYLEELTAIQTERLRRIESPGTPDPLSYRQISLNIRSRELGVRLESRFEEQIAKFLSGSIETRWRQLFMAARRQDLFRRVESGRTHQFLDVIAVAESIGPAFFEHPEVQPLLDQFAFQFDLIVKKKAEHQLDNMRMLMRQHDASLPKVESRDFTDHRSRFQTQTKALDQSLEFLCRQTVSAIQPLLKDDIAEQFRLAVLAARNPKLHAPNPIQILVDEADLLGVGLGEHDAAIRQRAAELAALDLQMLEQILAAHDQWNSPEAVEARQRKFKELTDAGRSQDASKALRGNHPAEMFMKRRFDASEAACRDVRALLGEEAVRGFPAALRLLLYEP